MSDADTPTQDAEPIRDTERLVAAGRSDCRAWELVRSLCDEVGPRYPCTPGDVAAVAWAEGALRRAGLVNVHAEPAPATLWERGAEACTLLLPRKHQAVLTALGGSIPTPGVIDAEVAVFDSLDVLSTAPRDRVEGKIAYIHHVMPRLRDGTGYNAASTMRMRGPSLAAAKGALACLVRSAGTDTSRVAHTGALHYDVGVPPIPAAALSTPDGDLLHRALSSKAAVRATLSLSCSAMHVGESNNVVGELIGSDRAREIVLIGAHLDSWDLAPGALDDAAGCAIAIEACRLLASLPNPPLRTVRVVLFANEELGSGGGIAYARSHADEADRHVCAIEADQGDGRPWALRVPATGREGPTSAALQRALAPLGVVLDGGPSRGGVDIGPLRGLGVPFIDLRQDATRYFDFHHTVNDVIENVSKTDLCEATIAFAVAVWVLANTSDRFPATRTSAAGA